MPERVGVVSLGCSKNLVNSEQMMYLLRRAGYQVSGETDGADIVLINTCGFIESAKTEAIETILEFAAAKEKSRVGKLVVAGCLPERYKDDILKELPEIDAVVGTGSFDDIVSAVDAVLKHPCGYPEKCADNYQVRRGYFGDINSQVSETARIITTSPVWAYLKTAEGCDNRCAYCCIPDIRGTYRSRPLENIIKEAEMLAETGFRELILVAQDLTSYGCDKKCKLTDLLAALCGIRKLKWLRLHYLYPDKIDDELIDVIAKSDKILKYLDIPIQHINDGILSKMQRRGSGNDIRALIKRLRERIPGVVLRTSLITGLPGEGEEEFEQLYEFLSEAKIERAGVFAYSPQDGTKAAMMSRPSHDVAVRRAEKLQDLQSFIMHEWNESRIGSVETVLVEDVAAASLTTELFPGRSYAESPDVDGYIHIYAQQGSKRCTIKPHTFIDVRITGFINGELTGEPADEV